MSKRWQAWKRICTRSDNASRASMACSSSRRTGLPNRTKARRPQTDQGTTRWQHGATAQPDPRWVPCDKTALETTFHQEASVWTIRRKSFRFLARRSMLWTKTLSSARTKFIKDSSCGLLVSLPDALSVNIRSNGIPSSCLSICWSSELTRRYPMRCLFMQSPCIEEVHFWERSSSGVDFHGACFLRCSRNPLLKLTPGMSYRVSR